MFTGIIECTGQIKSIQKDKANVIFEILSDISVHLKPEQSVSHDGVCLTIIRKTAKSHFVTAVKETLQKSTLSNYKKGDLVNLERSLQLGSRIDGHFIQGHVDCKSKITKAIEHKGSLEFRIHLTKKFSKLVVEKGSIAINGVSLTIAKTGIHYFSIVLIPYTLEHTNLKYLQKGDEVNIEFDILGKYIIKNLENYKKR
jgi:riboflavin synthase